MVHQDSPLPFLFVGNHPCLDFINTQIALNGQPVDLLATFSDLLAWSVEAQLLTRPEATDLERRCSQAQQVNVLEEVTALRAILREMMERITGGRVLSERALRAINDALRDRVGYVQLSRQQGRLERRYEVQTGKGTPLLGVLAEQAADLLTTRDWSFIKKCQNPACILFFYDTTKNHARHWCSMSVCGNRSKVAAHYRRHRK